MVSTFAVALALRALHPIHSSLTTVAWHSETRTLEVAVRTFTQDLQEALTRRPGTACAYAQAVLTLHDATGRAVPTTWCTTERQGDVTWIRLSATADDPKALRLSNALLFDLFADQINIVQTNLGGPSRTVLFTQGDASKPISD